MRKWISKILFPLATLAMLLSAMLPASVLAAVPAAPGGLYAVTINAGRVDLHWTDNSGNEAGFNVERAPDIGGLGPGTYARIGPNPSVPADTTVFYDTTVAAITAYWYRVAAVNADGSSFYSNQVRIITPRSAPQLALVMPAPPTATLQSGAGTTIEVSASDPGALVTSAEYQVTLDNAAGVFEAHDIYNTPLDLTTLGPRAPSPVADTTPMPTGLPAGAVAEFEIRGTVAAVNTGTGEWQIGTTPVMVYESVTGLPQSTRFVGSRRPAAGDEVKIVAYRTIANGPLVAKIITYIAPAQPVVAPTIILSFLYNETVTSIDSPVTDTGYLVSGEIWNVGSGKFRVDAPDFPAYIDESIGIGSNVTVRFATPAEPKKVARQIFRQITKAVGITTERDTIFDNTPVPLNVPAGTWLYVIVDGVVTDLDLVRGVWTIGDEQIKCYQTANTLVEPATVGDEVLVYCRRTITPGPLVAEQINNILPGRLIAPVKETAVEMHLMYNGVLQAMGPNTWTVGGQAFIIDDPEGKARIDPMPFTTFAIGDPVTVEFEHIGEVLPDNANWAPLNLDISTSHWTGTASLPPVPADLAGRLFLRITDSIQSGSTIAVPALLQVLPTSAPSAPGSLNATVFSGSRVDLDWADNSGDENNFRIERAPDVAGSPGTWAEVATVGANVTTSSDTTVTPNNTYHYRVFAVNIVGDSPSSNIAVVTTTPPPSKLVFVTVPRTVNVNTSSQVITVQAQDPSSAPANVLADTTVNLTSSSVTGSFAASAGGPFNGSSRIDFKYSTFGSPRNRS